MTKFSLKGTEITSLSAWTRDAKRHIWLSETTPDSAKDNPIAETLIQDLIVANIKAILSNGLITLSDTTNDAVAFAPSSYISVSGSDYTVDTTFYLYCNGNIFKVNTGTATLVDTIRLEISATEDGMFQTLDIADGTTVASFEGTSEGNGVVNYSDILWLTDTFSVDVENDTLNVGSITSTGDVTVGERLILGDFSELTISAGEITVTSSVHLVDTESDAATDNLTTINGGTAGMIIVLMAADSARTVVVVSGSGIRLNTSGGNFSLNNATDTITLIYNGSEWVEIARSNNGA